MKFVYWLIGSAFSIAILLFGVTYLASELGGEVVTLSRAQADGSNSDVRIWIVDENDAAWIEHGDPEDFWFARLAQTPELVLTRGGTTNTYLAVADPDSHTLYHQLRENKYGWADQLLAWLGASAEDCQGVPIRLQINP